MLPCRETDYMTVKPEPAEVINTGKPEEEISKKENTKTSDKWKWKSTKG